MALGQIDMIHSDLKRIDNHVISDNKKEIRLFSVMQNESLRLPYFLDYYRRLGVAQFFIIDNASKDETQKFLLEQKDCCVFYTDRPYSEKRYGLDWLNSLLDVYGDGHWILLVDADELFIYPHSEDRHLSKLCEWLNAGHYEAVYALMLDMYSALPLKDILYNKGNDFLLTCNHFDRHYHFVRRLGIPFLKPAFPRFEPIGGPRLRLCFSSQNTSALWPRLWIKIRRRLVRFVQKFGFAKNLQTESVAPQAFKIPLVKWRRGHAFITSHRLNPVKLSPLTGAIMHFKYFQDFSERVNDAVDKLNHYDGSAEYKMYAQLMLQNPDISFAYEGSVPYKGTQDLVHRRLVKTDLNWEKQ